MQRKVARIQVQWLTGWESGWHYWNSNFKNNNEESLEMCFEKYGLGWEVTANPNIKIVVVYTENTQNPHQAWVLSIFHSEENRQMKSKRYENEGIKHHAGLMIPI